MGIRNAWKGLFNKTDPIKSEEMRDLANKRWGNQKTIKADQSDQDFIDKMMKFEQFRAQIYENEQAKRNSIIQEVMENMPEGEEGEGMENTLIKILLPKLLEGGFNSKGATIKSNNVETQTTLAPGNAPGAERVLSDDQANTIVETIKKKVPGIYLSQIKNLTDADIINIKNKLLQDESKQLKE